MPPLSILIWLPAVCGILGVAASAGAQRLGVAGADAGRLGDRRESGAEGTLSVSGAIALAGAVAALALAIGYLADYTPGTRGLEHVTDIVWISSLGIHYKLGVAAVGFYFLLQS